MAITPAAVAQEVQFGAQVRPRYEFFNPIGGVNEGNTTARVRAEIDALLEGNVRIFVQLQDVRMWGEETNTLGDFSADNFDLHQGFIELRSRSERLFALRVGRQELSLGGERLVGAVDWEQQGRAFDGLRGWMDIGSVRINAFGFKLTEAAAPLADADTDLSGAYAVIGDAMGTTVDVYALYSRVSGLTDTDQLTAGARVVGSPAGFTFRAEGTLQVGKRGGQDVTAFMFGGRVGREFADGRTGLTLWYDYLSGDDDLTDDEVKVFDTLFATNHKFYGIADLFLDIPAHTGGLGLQDAAVKGFLKASDDVSVNLEVHAFLLARKTDALNRRLGEEVDATVTYRYAPQVSMTGGIAHVIDGSSMRALGRLTEDFTFAFVMVNAAF